MERGGKTIGDSALEMLHISKQIGDAAGIADFSLRLNKGALHGVLGAHCTGKTTLARILNGMCIPDSGRGNVSSVRGGRDHYYGIPAGVYVKEVEQGSAAANAGLQEGDIITAIDDTQVTSVEDLTNALATYSIGDSAELTVSREVSYPDIFAENGQSAEYQSGKTTVTFGSDEAQRTSLNEQ